VLSRDGGAIYFTTSAAHRKPGALLSVPRRSPRLQVFDSTTSIQQISISFKSIETSVAKECPLCLLFLDGMPSDDRTVLREQEARSLSELGSTSSGTVNLGGNKWQVILFENPSVLAYRSPKPRTPPDRYIFKNIHTRAPQR